VTTLSDIPIQGKMLIAAVGPRWCRHREEIIYMCTYSEMRILQLIVSETLANAGFPERVINKQTTTLYENEFQNPQIFLFFPSEFYFKSVQFSTIIPSKILAPI
jgi:hypothetical protein